MWDAGAIIIWKLIQLADCCTSGSSEQPLTFDQAFKTRAFLSAPGTSYPRASEELKLTT